MKKTLILPLAFISAFAANAQKKETPSKSTDVRAIPAKSFLKSPNDSFSYAVGINIANNMKEQGINDVNIPMMSRAFVEVFSNKTLSLSPEQARMTIQQKLKEYADKKAKEQKAKGEAFLAENKKRKGVITLPNGLQYEILKAGADDNIKPSKEDTVVVDYVGTLTDGTEFDNSVKRGQPATFPLGNVIKGWTEIMQLMTIGAQWKVYIPSDLGYGERGAGGSIPPNATLVFDITLKEIKPAVKK